MGVGREVTLWQKTVVMCAVREATMIWSLSFVCREGNSGLNSSKCVFEEAHVGNCSDVCAKDIDALAGNRCLCIERR